MLKTSSRVGVVIYTSYRDIISETKLADKQSPEIRMRPHVDVKTRQKIPERVGTRSGQRGWTYRGGWVAQSPSTSIMVVFY